MKKEKLFNDEIFNEKIYHETKKKYEQMAERLPDLLASLSAEGLPATWDYFQQITDADDSFKRWVDDQYKKRVSSFDFLPMDERNRIIDTYDALFEKLKDDVAQLRRMRRERLPLFDADGTIMVDMDKVDELAKKEATIKIDASKMQAYWEMVNKVVEAIGDLRNYEEKNGLPDSTFNPASIYTGLQGVVVSPNLSTTEFREKFSTPEQFQNIFLNTFKK